MTGLPASFYSVPQKFLAHHRLFHRQLPAGLHSDLKKALKAGTCPTGERRCTDRVGQESCQSVCLPACLPAHLHSQLNKTPKAGTCPTGRGDALTGWAKRPVSLSVCLHARPPPIRLGSSQGTSLHRIPRLLARRSSVVTRVKCSARIGGAALQEGIRCPLQAPRPVLALSICCLLGDSSVWHWSWLTQCDQCSN
jgi:hypothetical protein